MAAARPASRRLPFVTIPLVAAPMAGATSPAMVAAVAEAGGLGSLPLGYVRPGSMAGLVREVRALTDRPFACNLFVDTAPEYDAVRVARARAALRPFRTELGLAQSADAPIARVSFSDQCDAVFELRPAVFSFTFGIPDAHILARARALGIYTIGTAKTVEEAIALESAGVDAICVQGFEAGGHHGSFLGDPEDAHVGTLALVPQVVDAVRVPVIAAGGIGDGRAIAAVLALGASAAQVGSSFLLADESAISRTYREALAQPHARRTRLTTAFSGRTARGVHNRFMDEFEADDIAPYPDQNALTRDIRDAAAIAGQAAFLSLWAGQAVSLAVAQSTLAIVCRLMRETSDALDTGLAVFRGFPGREAYANVPMEHTDGALAHEHPASADAHAEPAATVDASESEAVGRNSHDLEPAREPVEESVASTVDVEAAVDRTDASETHASELHTSEIPASESHAGEAEAEPVTAEDEAITSSSPESSAPIQESAPVSPATPVAATDAAVLDTATLPPTEETSSADMPVRHDEVASGARSSEPPVAVAAGGAPRSLGLDPAVIERKRKAQESWERAVAAHASGDVLDGTVTSAVKGGLLVDVDGVRGFLPASQASPGPGVAIETLVKQKLPLKVIDVDATRKRVVVSHRRAAESAKRAARSILIKSLAVGQRYEATVVRLADFGAFVDIGSGVDGLVPMSELAFERVEKVGDLLAVGDTFEATIIRIEEGGRKIALSRKGALPDPWRDHADVVRIGATIEGTVVGKEPRLQVEIAPGIVGAVRESDADPAEYEIGEKIEVSVRNLDRRTRRITLTTLHGAAAAIVTNHAKQTGGFATLGEELMARMKKR